MKIFNKGFWKYTFLFFIIGLAGISLFKQKQDLGKNIERLQWKITLQEQRENQRQEMIKELVYYNKSTPLYAAYLVSVIKNYAKQRGLNPALVFAVVIAESGGDVNAKSVKSAKGLMQIMPATAKDLGCNGNLFEPEKNISCGTLILKRYIDVYGKEDGILSYLCGNSNGKCKKSFRSQAYLSAILRMENNFKEII